MKTQNPTSFKSSPSSSQYENKKVEDKETAIEFSLGIALGVITIILVSATAYLGLIRF